MTAKEKGLTCGQPFLWVFLLVSTQPYLTSIEGQSILFCFDTLGASFIS